MTRAAALSLVLFAALGTAAAPAAAQVQGGIAVTVGGGGRHWHGGGWGWGPRVGLGIGFAAPLYYGGYDGAYYGPGYGTYYAPGYRAYDNGTVLVAPPPVVYQSGPVPAPVPMTQPEPIVYPRNGQSAARTESDRRECNRWAIGQPNAMGDASVFQRATLACMEGRGYTIR
jgi:hypothetical protein